MTQQPFSQVSSPARNEAIVEKPVSECVCVKGSNPTGIAETGTHHTIRKIIKKSSVGYFCNECNTHYARLYWVLEDHPGFDVKNFNIHDLRNEDI